MVVTDFYGINIGDGYSARMQQLAPTIDSLSDDDADLIELTARCVGQS